MATNYANDFEIDIADWNAFGGSLDATRVGSGTNGIISASGSFHAQNSAAGSASRWGGYNYGAGNAVPTVFQEYTTSVDIYLNVGGGWSNDTRFDFTSAINNAGGTHRRDFIFNAGFYNDTDGSPGSGTSRFVISASNNTQPGSAFAKNPGKLPIAIASTGWYTFKHHFYSNAGVLAVQMSIYNSSGGLIHTWTLSDPTDLIAGIGGNRYGWFDYNQFSVLAFDNAVRAPGCSSDAQCADGQLCNGDETCVASVCVPGSNVASGTPCRPSAGICDIPEACDGLGSCPPDAVEPVTTVCRAAVGGGCDIDENCDGVGVACPADVVASVATVCRPAFPGGCDIAEQCNGTNTCPADVVAPTSTVCRPAVAGGCDVPENCDGSNACPADIVQPTSTVCRPAVAGGCDIAENCDGSNTCPADVVQPIGVTCRPAVPGGCDIAEQCTGNSNTCPGDTVQSSATICRVSAGICDVAENCTGSTATCPTDAFQPASMVCRAAATNCDQAESCTGAAATCPVDVNLPDGWTCGLGDYCEAGVCAAGPNSLVLNVAMLRVRSSPTKSDGSATVRGLVNDNDTLGGLAAALLAGSVQVRIEDAGAFDVTRTLTGCTQSRGVIRCRSTDRTVRATFIGVPGPYVYRMRGRFARLSAETGGTTPAGNARVTLDQSGLVARHDIIGDVTACKQRGVRRLFCRER